MRHKGARAAIATVLATVLTLPLLTSAAGDDPGPKSPKAKAALRKYDRSVERAKAEYDRAVAAAAKDLRSELDVALKAAMSAGSLAEAKAIEAAMPVGTKRGVLVVVDQASYGTAGALVDVTPQIRDAVNRAGGRLGHIRDVVKEIRDPAPGERKTLRILGTFAGQRFLLSVAESGIWDAELAEPQ
jgi:hypothetical protein